MTTFAAFSANQRADLPLLVNTTNCAGRTFIVTGANVGLGYESANHLVKADAQKVILACRNTAAGEEAKKTIETATNRAGVVEVWYLDMGNFESVKAFATRVEKLDRIDGLIENAGVAGGDWDMWQKALQINVLGTLYLTLLVLPLLEATAKKYSNTPHLVVVTSETAFMPGTKTELDKFEGVDGGTLMEKLNDRAIADTAQRYPFSKLLQVFFVRQLAKLKPVSETGVVINLVNPGLCKTALSRNAPLGFRLRIKLMHMLLGRTAEAGSRTLLHGVVQGKDSHGCYLSTCRISEDEVPAWVTDESGQILQKIVWDGLVKELESFDVGCAKRIL